MSELSRKRQILNLANEWASDVIALGAKRLSELMDEQDNQLLLDMTKTEITIFMQTYLYRILDAYNMQLRSLKNNSEEIPE